MSMQWFGRRANASHFPTSAPDQSKHPMRILILSQWFDPEPTFKGLLFARELVRRGHDVEVLTGFPNYPGGKLYPGYRILPWRREILDGIHVVRVALYPSHDGSSWRRALNYATFALSASVLGPVLVNRPDVVYTYHPPATVALPALVIKTLRRSAVVYDIQDLWPDTVRASGMVSGRQILDMLGRWCNFVYRRVDRLTVLSPGFRTVLLSRGLDPGIVHVIYNWCDEERMSAPGQDPQLADELGLAGGFNVVFAGTMGLAQKLETVLEAARICRERCPAARFVFVGGGIEKVRLEELARGMALENVVFLERQPVERIGRILALADVLLVHLKDDPLFCITIPSKTQAYMAAGKPILMAVRGDAAELVERAGAGLSCEPENALALADAVTRMSAMPREELDAMGTAGRSFYDGELSLRAGVGRFEEVFHAAVRWTAVTSRSVWGQRVKRAFDFTLALVALCLASPVLALAALAIRVNMGSPVLFRQVRPGWRERPFTILKLRTMRKVPGRQPEASSDAARLTRLGAILRKLSLDELPQLWNVVEGEMSLVGPRPLLPVYLPRYSPTQRRRHEVRPGITGWAQINGRNAVAWEQKFDLDVWYVDHWSLSLDGKILWQTLLKVIRREGIAQDGHATMPEFLGSTLETNPK